MGIWNKPGAVKQIDPQVVAHLKQLAMGFDAYGQPIPREHQLDAVRQYNAMVSEQQRIQLDSSRVANEAAQVANARMLAENDADRVANERLLAETAAGTARVDAEVKLRQLEMAQQRLQLEAHVEIERLQLAKAETFSRAMIAMINKSDTPEKLLPYLEAFGQKLLEQKKPEVAALQIEDKGSTG